MLGLTFYAVKMSAESVRLKICHFVAGGWPGESRRCINVTSTGDEEEDYNSTTAALLTYIT